MRRVNGEGTISAKPRADGLWVARYSIAEDGAVKRPVLYGKTRAEVAGKLRSALLARDRGERSPARESVADYLATWHEGTRPQLRDSSWRRQGEAVRLHLVPLLGQLQLRKLAPGDVSRAYAQLIARGLAPATVRRTHAVLHRALGQAVRWRMLQVNVAAMVDPPRIARTEMATLSPAQARELLAAAAGDRLEALLVVAITTGMRQGEILALRWADVDLEAGWLRVTGSLSAGVITETKTARSRRRVELTAAAVDALRRHRGAQLEERIAAANVWQDRGLVFSNLTGGFVARGKLDDRFHQLLASASLPRIRFHDLRHTAATLMLGRGVHPKVAAEMLGHSSIGITLDLYSHVTPTMQREAVAVMDDLFR
jgi:integrase